jgi:antitoxin component of MazEF toxin-antitoxin module
VKHIRERIAALGPEVKFTRKISKAGNRPAIYLPDVVVESMKLRAGDEVSIYMEGKRRLVIEPIEPAEA